MSFIKNLNWRYATKEFSAKEIPAETLIKILESIRLTPSSFGVQPYHITIIRGLELKAKLKPLAWNQKQITTCSHLLVFSARTDIVKRTEEYLMEADLSHRKDITNDPDYHYLYEMKKFAKNVAPEWSVKQAYIALGFALAACAELKVDSCPMEGFDPVAFKDALNLPSNLEPKVLLALGYRDPSDIHQARTKIRFSKADLFDER